MPIPHIVEEEYVKISRNQIEKIRSKQRWKNKENTEILCKLEKSNQMQNFIYMQTTQDRPHNPISGF